MWGEQELHTVLSSFSGYALSCVSTCCGQQNSNLLGYVDYENDFHIILT